MSDNWNALNWGDLATLEYGKGLRDYKSNQGKYRVYGTNGAIGWHSEPLCKHAGVIIGRKGAYRGVHYSKEPFYVIDTAFYLKPKQVPEIDLKWAYYELLTKDINGMDSGSAIPSTTRESFYRLPVKVPPIEEQRRIAEMLSALDEKIELNLEMNRTLEKIAQATFKHWFVDFQFPGFDGELVDGLPKGWRTGKLGEVLELVYGKALKSENRIEGKYPVIGSSGVVGFHNEFCVEGAGIVIGRKGTIGEVIWIDENFFPIDTTFFVKDLLGVEDLFFHFYLLQKQNFKNIASDSAVPGLNRNEAMRNDIIIPDKQVVLRFNEIIKPLIEKKSSLKTQNQTLTQIRDNLLPKLMSGKIRV
jgi:type I restriction enzyme S subunit